MMVQYPVIGTRITPHPDQHHRRYNLVSLMRPLGHVYSVACPEKYLHGNAQTHHSRPNQGRCLFLRF